MQGVDSGRKVACFCVLVSVLASVCGWVHVMVTIHLMIHSTADRRISQGAAVQDTKDMIYECML